MSFLIDDQDSQVIFGLTFLRGTYKALQKFPEPKPGVENDWEDENGTDRDLTDRQFKTRSLSIPVLLEGDDENDFEDKLQTFREYITTCGYFNLKVLEKNRQYTLLYANISEYNEYSDHAAFTLELLDDYPHTISPIGDLEQLAMPVVSIANLMQNEVDVTWLNVANAANYSIYKNSVNSLIGAALIAITEGLNTHVAGLTADTTYYFFVIAKASGYANSEAGTISATTTSATLPGIGEMTIGTTFIIG